VAVSDPSDYSDPFDYSETAREFRRQVREWIEANRPDGLSDAYDWRLPPITAGGDKTALDAATASAPYRAWAGRLLSGGLVCAGWPQSAGGSGWGAVQVAVFEEECFRGRVPRVTRGLGETLVGPAIITHGTEAQKARFLPRIIDGSDTYCQGFSEPGSGSDLASLRTRGVIDGDRITITGQKVWTSGFAESNMMMVLCRTDPDAPKHRGLTCVLLEIPGNTLSFRPIRQMTGAAYFAETFLDGARAPVEAILGAPGDGWRVANSVLAHERATNFPMQFAPFEHEFRDVTGGLDGSRLSEPQRDQLAGLYADLQLIRFQRLSFLALLESADEPGAEASAVKLYWSEYHQRFADLMAQVAGTAFSRRPDGGGYPTTRLQEMFLRARAETIFAGTSEIQRNVLAQRVLGLPRD
jgi:alkylation response protein AidB-like acyl-CoA dehydrogenase